MFSAEAQFRQARALVREARASYFPTVTMGLGVTHARTPGLVSGASARTVTNYSSPLDVSWELDVWGRIRRTVESNQANAQASAADLEAVRLSLQAALAQAYFQLRTYDAQRELLERTVAAYQKSLDLTKNRWRRWSGVVSRGGASRDAAENHMLPSTSGYNARPTRSRCLGRGCVPVSLRPPLHHHRLFRRGAVRTPRTQARHRGCRTKHGGGQCANRCRRSSVLSYAHTQRVWRL
jgi:hypothetical protein